MQMLRPLGLGEILDRIFQIYRSRFQIFIGIAAVGAGINLVGRAIKVAVDRSIIGGHASKPIAGAFFGLSTFVNIGIAILAVSLVIAATAVVVSDLYSDKQPGIALAYSTVRPHWFRLVALSVIAFLIACIPLVVIGMAMAGGIAAFPALRAPASPLRSLFIATIGIGFLLALIISCWLGLRYSLSLPASALEDLPLGKSLHRSALLSRKTRGRIFVMALVIAVIQYVLILGLMIPGLILLRGAPGRFSIGLTIYNLISISVLNTLMMPLYGIGLTLFYFDSRIRKEGYDIERLMDTGARSAGIPATSSSAEELAAE